MENQSNNSKNIQTEYPEDLKNNLYSVFQLFDNKNKGYITENDLMFVMTTQGFHPTKAEVKQMLNNPKGEVNFDEFVYLFQDNCNVLKLTEDQILASFKVFDKDCDGVISREEIREFLKNYIGRPTEEDIDELLDEVDINMDGQIDFSEYVAVFK